MFDWKAEISARKMGSLGTYSEKRTYEVRTGNEEDARDLVVLRAHREGLEHVRIDNIRKKSNG